MEHPLAVGVKPRCAPQGVVDHKTAPGSRSPRRACRRPSPSADGAAGRRVNNSLLTKAGISNQPRDRATGGVAVPAHPAHGGNRASSRARASRRRGNKGSPGSWPSVRQPTGHEQGRGIRRSKGGPGGQLDREQNAVGGLKGVSAIPARKSGWCGHNMQLGALVQGTAWARLSWPLRWHAIVRTASAT